MVLGALCSKFYSVCVWGGGGGERGADEEGSRRRCWWVTSQLSKSILLLSRGTALKFNEGKQALTDRFGRGRFFAIFRKWTV